MYKRDQPRHDGVGGLFALSEKENRKIVHVGPPIASSTAQRKFGRLDVEMIVGRVATSAFDDSSRRRYDKLWRISVIRVVVSFLFLIRILWINAHGIWYQVAVR